MVYFVDKLNIKGFSCKFIRSGDLQQSQSSFCVQILLFSLPSQSFSVSLVTESDYKGTLWLLAFPSHQEDEMKLPNGRTFLMGSFLVVPPFLPSIH